jgi:hypothetical protein
MEPNSAPLTRADLEAAVVQRRVERMDGNQHQLLSPWRGLARVIRQCHCRNLAAIKRWIEELARRIDGLESKAS